MFGLHKEEFKVDGHDYVAVADFINDEITIHGRKFNYRCPMDEYVNFEGNMRDFVEAVVNKERVE